MNPPATWAAAVLAAGRGTRMKSALPKVLHPLAGRPMVLHVLDALAAAGVARPVVVVGHGAGAVQQAVAEQADCVVQAEQLGTGHAVLQAKQCVSEGAATHLLVVNGDLPLVLPATLRALMAEHLATGAAVTIATCDTPEPAGLGRIVRDAAGRVTAIVEEKAATPEQCSITEINVGVYAFALPWLWEALQALQPSAVGEYYLTDVVAAAIAQGRAIATVPLTELAEGQGINDRVQLAAAEAVVRQRIRTRLMLAGVTMIDPASTFIDAAVDIAADTTLLPNTILSGRTTIGGACRIGPGAVIRDTRIGDRCVIGQSTLEEAVVEADTDIGPYCHLRPGAHVGPHVHLGNYVEIKNSRVRSRTAVGHFSYLGDADVGESVNIGAGTITCNYDGTAKHRTVIGDGAFVGSDSMLVAPVTIGAGAITGAGSVVTHDVPPNGTAVGVPARLRTPAAD